MNKVILSFDAKEDLNEIRKYITEDLNSPSAANGVVAKITKSLRNLESHPFIGAPLSSIVDFETNYRFLVCGNYLAFYRSEENTVYVSRILYGRRDYLKILFKNDTKE